MATLIFDIETGAQPESNLRLLAPEFSAPANYKDPEKIAAAIKEKYDEWVDKAALDASTGRVVAIGVWTESKGIEIAGVDDTATESDVIASFWDLCRELVPKGGQLIGFNILSFDLPFLIRRSLILGVPVPKWLRKQNRYWHDNLVDLMLEWTLGLYGERISLDRLAKCLGMDGKNGDGAVFAGLWESNREEAIAYLENDVLLTAKVAERFGYIDDLQHPCTAVADDAIPATDPAIDPDDDF